MIPLILRKLVPFGGLLASVATAQVPTLTGTPLFVSGSNGFAFYRIPAIVCSTNGTLLAFCEARQSTSDSGSVCIALCRSTDGGQTWGTMMIAQEEGGDTNGVTIGNPAPVVDETTGNIFLIFCRNNSQVFYTVSADDGLTWSNRVEITSTCKLSNWGWYATTPGHGIQLQRGAQAGRLLVPADHQLTNGTYGDQVIYSDDHGATWQLGAAANASGGINPNENQAVELVSPAPGGGSQIYFNSRNNDGTAPGNRAEAWSTNGGSSYNRAFTNNPGFVCPVCQGSVLRFRATDEDAGANCIVFCCPNDPASRINISIWSSTNEALVWSAPKSVYGGVSGYSDMALTSATGDVALVCEQGTTTDQYQMIMFYRFNAAWLVGGTATKLSTGTDLSGNTAGTWSGGAGANGSPAAADIAYWSATSLGGALTLTNNATWGAMDIKGATAAITISGAGTLTLNGCTNQLVEGLANVGLNTAAGGVNLTINNSLTVGGSQTWMIGAGCTLGLETGVSGLAVTFGTGATLTLSGAGIVQIGGNGATTLNGAGDLIVNGVTLLDNLQSGSSSSGYTGIMTVSNGTLEVNGAIDGGAVAVDGGILDGVGAIGGPVTLNSGTLAPATASGLGTLNISNALVLSGGTVAMRISKTGGSTASDSLAGLTSVTYGGTLTVTNVTNDATPLAVNDTFRLFNSGAYAGAFAACNLPALPTGLSWDLSGLSANGSLRLMHTNQVYTLTPAVWSNPSGGSWPVADNWSNSAVAAGTSVVADFSQLTLTTNATVTLDGARTIAGLLFNDQNANKHAWRLNTGSAGPLTLAASSGTAVISNNVATTIGAVIAGTGGLTTTGAGTLILTNLNTYSGGTEISAGTLQLANGTGSTAAAGTGAIQIDANGSLTFSYGAAADGFVKNISGTGTIVENGVGPLASGGEVGLTGTNTFSGLIQIITNKLALSSATSGNGAPRIAVASGGIFSVGVGYAGGTLTISELSGSGPVNPQFGGAGTRTLNINQSSTTTYSGVISDSTSSRYLAITKSGVGTLTLAGANTYTGATAVSGGTLLVNGSLAAGSTVTVAGGSLGGSGTIAGTVTVTNGGVLAPGANGLGRLTVNGTLTLATNAITRMEVNGASGASTLVYCVGGIFYGGSLMIDNLSGTVTNGQKFQIFSGPGVGGFSSLTSDSAPGLAWSFDASTGYLTAINTNPTQLTTVLGGGNLNLSWPADHLGWQLQVQTSSLTAGLSTNWVGWAGSTATNQLAIPISPTNPAVFLRLSYPPQ